MSFLCNHIDQAITPAPKRTNDLNSFLTPYNQLPNICDILWGFAKFNSMRAALQTDRAKRQSHVYPNMHKQIT